MSVPTSYYYIAKFNGTLAIQDRFLYRLTDYILKQKLISFEDIEKIDHVKGRQLNLVKAYSKKHIGLYNLIDRDSKVKLIGRINTQTAVHCEGGAMCFNCTRSDCVCNDPPTSTEAKFLEAAGMLYDQKK